MRPWLMANIGMEHPSPASEGMLKVETDPAFQGQVGWAGVRIINVSAHRTAIRQHVAVLSTVAFFLFRARQQS